MRNWILITFLSILITTGCADKNSFAIKQDVLEPVGVPPTVELPTVSEPITEVPIPKPEPPVKSEPPTQPQQQSQPEGGSGNTPREEPEEKPTEISNEAPKEPPANESSQQGSGEIAERGFITPTIYYFAVINEDENQCPKDSPIVNREGETLISVCKSTLEVCSEEGSCGIIQNGKKRSFNIIGHIDGKKRYFETTQDECKFGYGVSSSCLDPFYTLAADLRIYKSGDVIFVPAIKGLVLPDGSKHSGYFIIRDKGTGIVGKGRFDFFSGFYSWRSSQNPFKKIGLGSTKTRIPYFKIRGSKAKATLKSRAFPKLPANPINESP